MKLIGTLLFASLVGYMSYTAGMDEGQRQKTETVKAVANTVAKFAFICGKFNDPACLEDYRQ